MIPRSILSALLLCAVSAGSLAEEPAQGKLMAPDGTTEEPAVPKVDYNKACPEYKSYSTFMQYVVNWRLVRALLTGF